MIPGPKGYIGIGRMPQQPVGDFIPVGMVHFLDGLEYPDGSGDRAADPVILLLGAHHSFCEIAELVCIEAIAKEVPIAWSEAVHVAIARSISALIFSSSPDRSPTAPEHTRTCSLSRSLSFTQQIEEDADEKILLLRAAFSDHQGHGDEGRS